VTPDQLTAANLLNFEIERAENALAMAEAIADHPLQCSILRAFTDQRIPEEVERDIRNDVLARLSAHRAKLVDQFANL
jgi:hypothetical protein